MINNLLNRNLTINDDSTYMGLSVNTKQTLATEYLQRLYHVMGAALEHWDRVMLFHVTLSFPGGGRCVDDPANDTSGAITRFIESFKAKIDTHYKNKANNYQSSETKIRYAWAREREDSVNDHYHVYIFLDGDVFYGLGDFNNLSSNMASRIVDSWASSINVDANAFRGLAHFCGVKYIRKKSKEYSKQRQKAFEWLSYLAKLETKPYGSKTNYFGCSRR